MKAFIDHLQINLCLYSFNDINGNKNRNSSYLIFFFLPLDPSIRFISYISRTLIILNQKFNLKLKLSKFEKVLII